MAAKTAAVTGTRMMLSMVSPISMPLTGPKPSGAMVNQSLTGSAKL